jgi:cardiolipin synthase
MPHWEAIVGLVVGYGVSLILIRWVILTRRRQPASTVAWILAIILLPYVGGVLFLFFGINRVSRRKSQWQALQKSIVSRIPHDRAYCESVEESPRLDDTQRRIARLATRVDGSPLTCGNCVEIFNDTNIALRRIEEAILAAKETIHFEYYIWRTDRTGQRIRDLMVDRAKDGVRVRVLYDGFGSMWLTNRFLKPLIKAGATVSPFVPGQNLRERWSINLRSHRKIVVVDSREGFTGGMNIGDEYQGRKKTIGFWRDTHMALRGPAVRQLQQVFVEDWYYATGEELLGPAIFREGTSHGDVVAQVISSAPQGRLPEFHAVMFSAINDAREEVLLTTSYFVPTESLLTALCTAAARGVRVRLLLPAKSDQAWVVLAGRSYFDVLLEAGVEIHEYRRGMLHAKTMVVDGRWSLVGTPNFDPRSLLLNFEVGVALYDRALAALLAGHFEEDLGHARLIRREVWEKRPLRSVFAENVCRLFSPIL